MADLYIAFPQGPRCSVFASVLLMLLIQKGVVILYVSALVLSAPWRSAAFCAPVSPGPPQDSRQREWIDYTSSHAGNWRGVWTTYDPEGMRQGEADRMDTNLELSADRTTMKHINTLYVGSIDSECSTCFDSVETRDIPVGEYTKDTFRQRASGAVYLNGPGVTRRGYMTTEVGVRLGERRVRCIVVHRPPLEQLTGPEPPAQLALESIVVVRETMARTARQDETPSVDSLSSQFNPPSILGLWRGNNRILESGGDGCDAWSEEKMPPSHLRKCRCSGVEDGESHASFEFDGGIFLEAPKIVLAGEPAWAYLRVGHRSKEGEQRIVQAKVRFEALSRIVDTSATVAGRAQSVKVSPPKLLRFDVANLEPVQSAGLGRPKL